MAGHRGLLAIVAFAAVLHAVGIARTPLPAQDGLKFIRVARQFQSQPWADVVRGSDQHPLYPALIALAEPVVALPLGHGPDTWRIAAQLVATLAALALIVPLFGLTRALFNERIAVVGVLIYVLLPLPAAVGHDTLSDSLGLLAVVSALWLGEKALRTNGWPDALGSGIAAGLGYLARPEAVVAAVAVGLAGLTRCRIGHEARRTVPRIAVAGVAFLALVGCYALVKGQVSEKLALRIGASLRPETEPRRSLPNRLSPGLDDPRWDFSPKEEGEEPEYRSAGPIVERLIFDWVEGLAWVFAFFAIWGAVRDPFIRRWLAGIDSTPVASPADQAIGRRLTVVYLALFSAVLVRHVMRLGYLSSRHTLTLVIVSIPWAAAGAYVCARRLADTLGWSQGRSWRLGALALACLAALSLWVQLKPAHATRWGHGAAGRWLIANTSPADAVLDTRGWAAFVSGRPSYDYWHVRQALTDAHLGYIVVGTDELEAPSQRAETLRAVLAYAATPVAEFPARRGGSDVGVRVFRYQRPASWEGLRP